MDAERACIDADHRAVGGGDAVHPNKRHSALDGFVDIVDYRARLGASHERAILAIRAIDESLIHELNLVPRGGAGHLTRGQAEQAQLERGNYPSDDDDPEGEVGRIDPEESRRVPDSLHRSEGGRDLVEVVVGGKNSPLADQGMYLERE